MAPALPLARGNKDMKKCFGVVTPLENDCLCSKDKTHSANPGNRLFRERIEAYKDLYQQTTNKQGKMEITRNIVKQLKVNYGTRFLKRDATTGAWVEISDQASRDKVSHALRFATRNGKKSSPKGSSSNNNNKGLVANAPGNHKTLSHHHYPEVADPSASGVLLPSPSSPSKLTVAREVSVDATAMAAGDETGALATAAASATTNGAVPTISFLSAPVEHTEASKWLLALRQGV